MREKIKKKKISKKQFAELLDHWLWGFLSEKAVKKTAKDFDFEIRTNRDFIKIFEELFILNMWLIVYTCERMLEDEDERNDVLDIFHHLEYSRYFEKKEKSFSDWMKLIVSRYSEYSKAMETEHPSTPLWVLASLINKNLFGEVRESAILQMSIISQVASSMQHLVEVIKHYDIK